MSNNRLARCAQFTAPMAATTMAMQPAYESLPAAISSAFDAVAATAGDDPALGIRTSDGWATLLSALSSAGLLPQTELLAASLVSRRAFEQLGGFTEDGGVGHEDWELWAR